MAGGGKRAQPGEISLSHHGVLFLDELPEYKRQALEVMRQPLEDRIVTIARARFSVEYPAGFMLVASMNPCPCGFYSHPTKPCVCPPGAVRNYLNKISGPLLDRIDMHVEVTPVDYNELMFRQPSENSKIVRERVIAAREIQHQRFAAVEHVHNNAQMNSSQLREFCRLDNTSCDLLKKAMEKFNLSARAFDRIIKVSRTIADLEGEKDILSQHISEAIRYRSLDRADWAG
jgi:magnesium chelatase family protein